MIEALLQRLARSLTKQKIPYMIIGGQAVLFYGFPRLTQDVDVTLGVGIEDYLKIQAVCREAKLISLVKDVRAFLKQTHVFPTKDKQSSLRVDFIFSSTPYEQQAIERARKVRLGKAVVRFASLEDLIIHKFVAGRAIDLEDVRALLAKHRKRLDARYVRLWLKQFAALEMLQKNPLKEFDKLWRQ